MGVYVRTDSPFYWMLIERPGRAAIRRSTKIPVDAPDAMSRKLQRQQAEVIYNAAMVDLARQRADLPELAPQTITLQKFSEWYDEHVISHHRGDYRERTAVGHLVAAMGHLDLRDIRHDHAKEYETARLKKVRASTVNREIAILKSMLTAAVPKYLERNPLAGRKHLRVVARAKRVLTAEEEARLLPQLEPVNRALYIVAVDTLVRLSNIINLRRDEDHGTFLALTDSKTGPYTVPLSTRARAALDSLPDTGEYYFSHHRSASSMTARGAGVRRALQRACAACTPPIPYGRAIGGITFHTATRATGATRMLQRGVDPRTVQSVGNWASFEQMGTYLHTDTERKRRAVELIAPREPDVIDGGDGASQNATDNHATNRNESAEVVAPPRNPAKRA